MDKKIILIGLNNFGSEIARTLTSMGYRVFAADSDKERLQNVKEEVYFTLLLEGDSISELEVLGITPETAVILVVGNELPFSMACAVWLSKLGAKDFYVCAENENQELILRALGDFTILRVDQFIAAFITERLSLTALPPHSNN